MDIKMLCFHCDISTNASVIGAKLNVPILKFDFETYVLILS